MARMTSIISVNWHATGGIAVGFIIPDQNGCIVLEDEDARERLSLYLPEEQWIALLEALPLSEEFYVSHSSKLMKGKAAFDFLSMVYGVRQDKLKPWQEKTSGGTK